jgi:hypothetical protein
MFAKANASAMMMTAMMATQERKAQLMARFEKPK